MLARPAAVVALVALFGAPGAGAQQDACLERTVPVGVINHSSAPEPIFRPENFQGSYRGAPVTVRSIAEDREPRRIVLVLAAGGRDAGLGLDLAAHFAQGIREAAQTGMAVVSGESRQSTPLTDDRTRMSNAVAGWRVAGGPDEAALWDSVEEAISLLGMPQFGDVIYVISDGRSGRNQAEPDELRERLVQAGIRLLFTAIVADAGASPPGDLSRASEATGGAFLAIPRSMAGSLPGLALRRLYDRMAYPYRAEITLPEPVDRPRDWELELTGLLDSDMENLELVYPRRLYPCGGTGN